MICADDWECVLDMDVPTVIRDWVEPAPQADGPRDHPVDLIMTLVYEYGDMGIQDANEDDLDAMYDRIHDALVALSERERTPYV